MGGHIKLEGWIEYSYGLFFANVILFCSFLDHDPVAIPAVEVNQKILIENIGRRDTGD